MPPLAIVFAPESVMVWLSVLPLVATRLTNRRLCVVLPVAGASADCETEVLAPGAQPLLAPVSLV